MKSNKRSRIIYLVLLAFAAFVQLALLPDYRTSKLVYYGSTIGVLLTVLFAVTGLVTNQALDQRSKLWRTMGALPLIAGAMFIGAWKLIIVLFILSSAIHR